MLFPTDGVLFCIVVWCCFFWGSVPLGKPHPEKNKIRHHTTVQNKTRRTGVCIIIRLCCASAGCWVGVSGLEILDVRMLLCFTSLHLCLRTYLYLDVYHVQVLLLCLRMYLCFEVYHALVCWYACDMCCDWHFAMHRRYQGVAKDERRERTDKDNARF